MLKTLVRTLQTKFPSLLEAKVRVQRFIRRTGRIPHEPEFRAIKLIPRSPDDLYLDVGGNRGQSIDSILAVYPGCMIQSFEPNPLLADRLSTLFRQDPRVMINAFGLGDRPGTFHLHVPFYNKFMFDGLASFNEVEARDWLKSRIWGFDENRLVVRSVDCEVKTLDSLHLNPRFIKLDVQGFELLVLRGASETLRRCSPVILLEAPTSEELDYVSQFGYSLWGFDGDRFVPNQPGQREAGFFIRECDVISWEGRSTAR